MSEPIKTILVAPSQEALMIKGFLERMDQHRYQILRTFHDMETEATLQYIVESEATLIFVHQGTRGFSAKGLKEMAYKPGKAARIVAAIVKGIGDVFTAASTSGAHTFILPIRLDIFEQIDTAYDSLFAEASRRMAQAYEAPEDPDDVYIPQETLPGTRRQVLQVLTSWSSKGGDGKTMLAMELAYMLANVSARRVLLVDGDMNRGYIAAALGKERMNFAKTSNIATLATAFRTKAALPPIEEKVLNYPPAKGKGARSNLDILFGLPKPDQAILPGFADEDGKQATRFIEALRSAAEQEYEFLIFDIGSLVLAHVHQAALKACTALLVVSSPTVPAIEPTREGVEQMKRYKLIDTKAKKARLVLNRYSKESGFSESDFPAFIHLETLATIPVLETGTLQSITNSGQFYMEAFLEGNNDPGLRAMARGLLTICEFYSPGTMGHADRLFPQLGKEIKREGRKLFGLAKKARLGAWERGKLNS